MPTATTFQPGDYVRLQSHYDAGKYGTLIGDRPVWGRYDLHTIKLPDGTLCRAEGILLPA